MKVTETSHYQCSIKIYSQMSREMHRYQVCPKPSNLRQTGRWQNTGPKAGYHYTLCLSRLVNFCKFSREAREACLHLKRVELLKSLVRAARFRIYAHTNNNMHTCTWLVYNYQIQGKHGLTHTHKDTNTHTNMHTQLTCLSPSISKSCNARSISACKGVAVCGVWWWGGWMCGCLGCGCRMRRVSLG